MAHASQRDAHMSPVPDTIPHPNVKARKPRAAKATRGFCVSPCIHADEVIEMFTKRPMTDVCSQKFSADAASRGMAAMAATVETDWRGGAG
jgi:hypothetical protein